MKRPVTIVCTLGLLCVACGSARTGSSTTAARLPPAASAEPAAAPEPTAGAEVDGTDTGAPAVARGEAHAWLVAAVGCWLGGMWSDAEGADEASRINASKERCRTLVRRLYGDDDQARYERLRAVDPSAIADLRAKIENEARSDASDKGRAPQLLELLDSTAAAAREAMSARRFANDIKNDIAVVQPATKRKADEVAAVEPLGEDKAFEALLRLDAGDLSPEARAIALLYALDRMEAARGLPTHVKLYAVARPFAALFGISAPQVSADASTPIKGGIWLHYLMAVANAAGHPMPERARLHRDQELMAWGGIFMGLADRLSAEAEQIADASELQSVAHAVARRLGIEYRASEAAIEAGSKPTPP